MMVKILSQLFKDIDINGNGQLDWDEFTNYIIEKAVINGSEKKNKVDAIKTYSHSKSSPTFVSDSNIEHLINMDSIGKFGVVEDYSNTVRIFSSETGQPVGKNLEITNEIYKLNSKNKKIHRASKKVLVHDGLFLQDQNLVLTSCNDCTIRAWEPNGPNFSNANLVQGYPLFTAKNPQRSLTWDESNHLLYSGENSGNINVWKLLDSKRTDPYKVLFGGHCDMISDLISIPKLELLVSCSQDRNIILWDTITSSPRRIYSSHSKGVLSLAFNQDYRLLFSAGFDHDIYVWNPYIDSVAFVIEGHNSSLVGVRALPGTPQIVSTDIDGWVKV